MATKPRRVGNRGGGRVGRQTAPTVDSTGTGVSEFERRTWQSDCVVDCGWGRLIFAHTFSGPQKVAEELLNEAPGARDIAFYIQDPHVALATAPHKLFLDPSHSYRLWFSEYRQSHTPIGGIVIAPVQAQEELEEVNRIYLACGSRPVHDGFLDWCRTTRKVRHLFARDEESGEVIGTIMGVDHVEAFNDTENGSSLWSLAVDPQSRLPGVGEALVRSIIERFQARGRAFMDLSVLYDNKNAIRLYEKLGFRRIPVFAIKTRNSINERLYVAPEPEEKLNPYARIIVDEARRRGITVNVLDAKRAYFALSFGGRRIVCRESLSELTSAIAMSRCDDKAITREVVSRAGLKVPAQMHAGSAEENAAFLADHGSVVVKPARGEQGTGVFVDLRDAEAVEEAVESARKLCDTVLLEEFVTGSDLRIIVIGDEVVAAAIRRPAEITGTGDHTVSDLIERQSRRRSAATGGESRIPVDDETMRCLDAAGLTLDSVLEKGRTVAVRKTANLHTGGTIHDVTERLHPDLVQAAITGAKALEIPLVGFDFIVPDVEDGDYRVIEANERPGLANHEPAPTAQKFIDLLFPQTVFRPHGADLSQGGDDAS